MDAPDPTQGPPAAIALPPGVKVGRHTYGYDAATFRIFIVGSQIEVGAFCSFGPEVRILAGSEHITDRATTFPLNALLYDPSGGNAEDAIDRGVTTMGHDVWIGLGATVLSGVIVGDGAVIGAGAVVSKSVPAYAVVAGNPAQVIRYRFDQDTLRRLQAIAWWDWDDQEIRAFKPWFMGDVESFLREAERRHQPAPESEHAKRLRMTSPDQMTPDRDWPDSGPGEVHAEILRLRSTIASMQATSAWRWALRYWRLKASIGRRAAEPDAGRRRARSRDRGSSV
jgi:acetyltransferase-like isoleucine patch superfamily enzyme